MRTTTFIASALLASLTAFAGSAIAQDAGSIQSRPVTRAEVLADLQIYRESGLAQAELPENFGVDSPRRAQAQAKYAQLRNSTYFAALVKRYGDGADKTEVAATTASQTAH